MEGLLVGLTREVGAGFRELIKGADHCNHPAIADAAALRRAYMALGLAYLEGVEQRVSDCAEASGQIGPQPPVSFTFNNSTVNGGQFAAQLANIDSTIAGVVQNGSSDIGEALKALTQAVLSQEDLGDTERSDLLDNVGELAQAAQSPPEERRRGVIRPWMPGAGSCTGSCPEYRPKSRTYGPA
ncbi:hypothetical protein GCM10022403_092940 [Streptomyces coacervatus]|uniref:Uncharacterized protein n=1 Tax=Streptomyces coacervatus TaxID=647381 RepID=A0ABP7JKL8_9ACTN|nr:hypothetical protein [Streptomyces coacervatus]MDF2264554.1 hypothetical protein [Streptomyces coacervatus]